MSIVEGAPEEPDQRLELAGRVIKHLLYVSGDYLLDQAIQKLTFISDLYCTEQYGARITEVEYKPTMYGPYSEDIDKTLEMIRGQTRTKHTLFDGDQYRQYSWKEPVFEPNGTHDEILKAVYNTFKDTPLDDLVAESKSNRLFDETEFGEPMDFAEYREKLLQGVVEPAHVVEPGTEQNLPEDVWSFREDLIPLDGDEE